MSLGDHLRVVLDGQPLSRVQARAAMSLVMAGRVSPVQLAAFLTALRLRGERYEELVGFAQAMRARATRVRVRRFPLLDTCGTGGDGSGTFNISTAAAFIAAGAGAAVAKHGNRSVSSRCGSADVLEALGVNVEASPAVAARCVERAGVGFLFAPRLHPAMRHAAPVRRELACRTVFNLLGPMSNPAGATRQLLGVYSTDLVEPVARALLELGSEEVIVVSSKDGLDELSTAAPSVVAHGRGRRVRVYEIDPRRLGIARPMNGALRGADAAANAVIFRRVLSGRPGPALDVCLLNAAAALVAAGLARGLSAGLERARRAVESGKALAALEALKRASRGGRP